MILWGYHEYRGGGVRYCGGYHLLLFEYLHGTEHLDDTDDVAPHVS